MLLRQNQTMPRILLFIALLFLVNACASTRGTTLQTGEASWYGPGFHGKTTANGETYDQNALTAAHRTLPFDTRVRVVNMENGKSVVVRINDRGPYVGNRVIDLSRKAAQEIDMIETGVARVRILLIDSKEPINTSGRGNITIETYTVQLASFDTRRDAIRYSRRIRGADVERATVDGKTVYRVYYGEYRSRQRAERAKRRLDRKGHSGFVRQVQNTRTR